MYTIYILISEKDKRTYTGYTNNLSRRLQEHNSGKVTATKNRRPLQIFFTEKRTTRQDAEKRERWWKSSSGRNQ